MPTAASLDLFVWLLMLSLHPIASRCMRAYEGVCVILAQAWLRMVDEVKSSVFDWIGAVVTLLGMGTIVAGWRS